MKTDTTQYITVVFTGLFITLFTFFLPISTSIKSIFLVGSLIFVVANPYYNKYLFAAFNNLWGWAAVSLFFFILMACFWSQAPYSLQKMIVSKYLKLIYLPIFAVGFIFRKLRVICIHSYLAAIMLTCIISILKAKGVLPAIDPGEVFHNHIITGFMVAFGSYLAGLLAFRSAGRLRIGYILLFLITSYQVMFINTGRTGYLIYFVLVALLLIQYLSFKKAVLSILFFCVAMTGVYHESLVMQTGIKNLIHDIKFSQQNNENTSLGYRRQFHAYAKSLWATQPLIGIGTGGFKYNISKDNPIPSWQGELTDPHSQYWLTLVEQGLIGLLLLLFFLGSLLITSFRLLETRPILLGILVAFGLSSFTDTILCYSAAGFLLMLMSALSLGEYLGNLEPRL